MNIFKEYSKQWQTFSKNIKAYLIFDSCNQFSVAVFVLYFPRYLIKLGYQEDLYGSLMGSATVMIAVFSILAGIISDRIGRRNSIMIGMGVSKITYILRAFLVFIPILYGAHIAHGIFITLYTSSLIPYIYENSTVENRVHAFSARAVIVRFANILGNLLGGILPLCIMKLLPTLNTINVYRVIFSISLLVAGIGYLQLLKIKPLQKEKSYTQIEEKSLIGNIKSLSKENISFVIRFGLVSATLAFGAGMLMPFINTFFLRKFNAGPETTGLVFSLANIAVIIGISFAPLLSKKLGVEKAIVITRAISLPLFLIMGFATKYWIVAIAYLLRATLQQMSNPLQNNFIMNGLDKNSRATANGIFNTASEGARSIALFIAGNLIVAIGYSSLFVLALVFYGISIFLFFKFFILDKNKKTSFNQQEQNRNI